VINSSSNDGHGENDEDDDNAVDDDYAVDYDDLTSTNNQCLTHIFE